MGKFAFVALDALDAKGFRGSWCLNTKLFTTAAWCSKCPLEHAPSCRATRNGCSRLLGAAKARAFANVPEPARSPNVSEPARSFREPAAT